MSVLTVANTVPDRAFSIPQGPLSDAPTQSLPRAPVELPAYNHPGASTQNTKPASVNVHRHSRTVSSSLFPADTLTIQKSVAEPRYSYVPPSSAPSTASRPSQILPAAMQRHCTSESNSNASLPRRSTSGRSVTTNSPSSYVALMRKQKATVWCDRAQAIDARMAAQQKAAKQRAVLEVVGTSSQRTSTIGSASMVGKIRHGGVAKAPNYTAPNMTGAGVPTRLLAFDMLGEEEQEGRVTGDNNMVHARTGSGKSSINSGQYRSGYPRTHTSPPEGGSPAHEGIPEAGETPVPHQQNDNYFDRSKKLNNSDSEESFGELKEMSGPSSKQHAMDLKAKNEDIQRRGSVDDRTTSLSTKQRLFVTNPDA